MSAGAARAVAGGRRLQQLRVLAHARRRPRSLPRRRRGGGRHRDRGPAPLRQLRPRHRGEPWPSVDISILPRIYLYIYAVLLRGGRGGDQLRAGLPADQQLRAARIHRVRGWRQQAAPLRGQLPLINISRASFTYLATIYNYYRQTDIKSFFIFVICDMFQRNGN